MLQNGEILDGMYQIIGEIGSGGTGIIYLAEHLRLRKRVIVKKVKDNFTGHINTRGEADILKRLHHSYLPQVYDFLEIGTGVYTVMEYVEGNDLQYYLDRNYQFPEETLRMWLYQLAEVLEYLHSLEPPILHSDIKPGNIMITTDGNVCLIDFNISLDGENSKDIQGISPWYGAPEQYEKAQNILCGKTDHTVLDGRMDIYSLGASFYRLMSGYMPSPERDGCPDIRYLDIPYSDGLKAVIGRAMGFRPSMRFQTAAQMKRALSDMGRMDPVYRKYGWLQAGAAFAYALCVVAGLLCIYYGTWRSGMEGWQKDYRALYQAAETENETTVVSKGTEMLNQFSYKQYREKNPGKKAEVCNILGESYYRQENYETAAEYYQEAWELEEDNMDYCLNYVMALVYSGDTGKARRVMGQAGGTGEQAEQTLVEAQILYMEEHYGEAIELLDGMSGRFEETAGEELLQRACLLQASAYVKENRYMDSVEALKKAESYGTTKEVLRQMGETAYEGAYQVGDSLRRPYLNRALESYEKLAAMENPSYEDRLNLAIIQRKVGQFKDSNDTLKAMDLEHLDSYEIPMWMCYNYLSIAENAGSFDDVREDLNFRFGDGKHRYQKSGEENENMEKLIEIMNEMGA